MATCRRVFQGCFPEFSTRRCCRDVNVPVVGRFHIQIWMGNCIGKERCASVQRNNLKICRCVSKLNELYALQHLRVNIANLAGVEASASIVMEVPLHTKLGVEVPPQSTPFETLFRCPPLLKCGHGPRIIVDTLVTVRFLQKLRYLL